MTTKAKRELEPTMEEELEVIASCLESIAKLKNYKAEKRVVDYIAQRLKGDKRRFGSIYD